MERKTFVGLVVAVCVSSARGRAKEPVAEAVFREGFGIEGDAHAGAWHRQVSLLAVEEVERFQGTSLEIPPGAFGENVLTRGIDLDLATVGSTIRLGEQVLLEVTQRGKECHQSCAIGRRLGTCIMPVRGVFARVLVGGRVRPNDPIEFDTLLV